MLSQEVTRSAPPPCALRGVKEMPGGRAGKDAPAACTWQIWQPSSVRSRRQLGQRPKSPGSQAAGSPRPPKSANLRCSLWKDGTEEAGLGQAWREQRCERRAVGPAGRWEECAAGLRRRSIRRALLGRWQRLPAGRRAGVRAGGTPSLQPRVSLPGQRQRAQLWRQRLPVRVGHFQVGQQRQRAQRVNASAARAALHAQRCQCGARADRTRQARGAAAPQVEVQVPQARRRREEGRGAAGAAGRHQAQGQQPRAQQACSGGARGRG